MAPGIPLDLVDSAMVVLPHLLWLVCRVDLPQVDLIVARRSQRSIILPGDINNAARSVQVIFRLLLNFEGIPDKEACFLAAGRHERVRLVPD